MTKKKKNRFKNPPTDVMTHGIFWVLLSVAFFIFNYYAQSILGYTLADPQIFQFIIAPIIWAVGLGLHAYTHQQLNQSFVPLNVTRGMRHKVRDIHIGLFVAFFMMLISMGLTASIVSTGSLGVLSTLVLLVPWATIVGIHSWVVRFLDLRSNTSHQVEDTSADISRLVDDFDDLSEPVTDELNKATYQTS